MSRDILAHAADVLRRGYSTGWPLARRADGAPCHPNHREAAAWSLQGALMRAAYELSLDVCYEGAKDHVSGRLWETHGLLLPWAELDPRMDVSAALTMLN